MRIWLPSGSVKTILAEPELLPSSTSLWSLISLDFKNSVELEKEAKSFAKKTTTKRAVNEEKPLTPRQQLAGYALAGLLARSSGLINRADIKREAYGWADWMLEDD